MLLMKRTLNESQVVITEPRQFDENVKYDAIIEFDNLSKRGIIVDCEYEDDSWYLYNESSRIRISFDLCERKFMEERSFRNIGSYSELVNVFKFYILYRLSFTTIISVRTILNSIKKIFLITRYFREDCKEELMKLKGNSSLIGELMNVIDILDFYPIDVSDDYFELMYNLYEDIIITRHENQKTNQRELGNLESVFKFGDVLNDFWDSASICEKEKYYPIKLWWEITTLIPIRTTEFTLIPYDCLVNENGKLYIKVVRSDLKGSREKVVNHKVTKDYTEQKLRINSIIYELIEEYKEFVDSYDFEEHFYYEGYEVIGRRSFLLSRRSYFKMLKEEATIIQGAYKTKYNLEHFQVGQLDYLLDCFHRDIIQNRYNLKILTKNDNTSIISETEIQIISLMDTRHYAFINLVLNEVEPLLIKEISGHKDINSSYHYYNHVKRFVKCYTYSMAKRIALNKKSKMNIATIEFSNNCSEVNLKFEKIFEIEESDAIETKKGKCNSKQVYFEDCLKVNNKCELCNFATIKNNRSDDISKIIDENHKLIDQEIESLKKLLKQSKKIKNLSEKQQVSINKIKAISDQNSQLIGTHIL